jgi:3-phytase
VYCVVGGSSPLAVASAQDVNLTLIAGVSGFGTDNIGFVYSKTPFLVVNDGSAADGGFRTFAVSKSTPFKEKSHQKSGRSKVAVLVYSIVDGRDVILNTPAPDSLIRVFDAESGKRIDSNDQKQLGDWSAACVWRSQKSGESYMFLFGKKIVVQFLVRDRKKDVEIIEVSTDGHWPISHD